MADAAQVLADVKGVGAATRSAVLERYPDLSDLALADPQDLTSIKGVGPATAQAIKDAVGSALEAGATADLASAEETTPNDAVAIATSTAEEPVSSARGVPSPIPRPGIQRGRDRAGEAGSPVDRVRTELEETLRSVRDAAMAVGGVLLAAVSAGRDQLPEVTENLREAGASASRTATSLLAVVKGPRDRR